MDDGAKLVADDQTELYLERGRLCARAPKSIAGLIEVRELGIVAQPFAKKVIVTLAVKLVAATERLPKAAFYTPPEPLRLVKKPPFILLDGRQPSAPAKIR